ncbi:MAG: hypothetical protein HY697_03235 [Deltaproteobacteria bacterium]|nr:hypothetical protein [Deltaproteobacteria bacterium]
MPVCGREVEIVTELAEAGSPNHRLLRRLMERGAKLEGTESAALLMEEYALAKRVLEAKDARQAQAIEARQGSQSGALLLARDRFIARRIHETLLPGETGLLFLGLLHDLRRWLDRRIRVFPPFLPPGHPKGEENGHIEPEHPDRG